MKKNIEIFLLILCLVINYLLDNYFSLVIIMVILMIYLFDEKEDSLKKIILKLEVINQIYLSKEEKLDNVFGPSNIEFDKRCKILSQNAKLKKEKEFFDELSLCNNKTSIDNLIFIYKSMLSKNQKDLVIGYFLLSFFTLLMIKLFPSFSYSSSVRIVLFISSIFVLFDYLFLKRTPICSFSTRVNRLFIKFYSSLSYLRPMESLIKLVDDYPYKNNPYEILLNDIRESKMSFESKIYDKYPFFSHIYKLCYSNKFSRDLYLEEHFKKCIDKSANIIEVIRSNIISLSFVLITIGGIFL